MKILVTETLAAPVRGAQTDVRSEPQPRIGVVVLTRNEEATIARVLQEIRAVDPSFEIVVVDGHSADRTVEIAAHHGVRVLRDGGRGKGDGIRTAIAFVDVDLLVFIDADGSYDPADIPRLLAPILEGRADHVTGSRMLGGSDELFSGTEHFLRLVGSAIITLGINYRFGVQLTDSQSGFRAIRADVARSLGLREDITTIEQEMLIKSLHRGVRVVEVAAHEKARCAGQSVIVLRKVWFRYVYTWLRYLLVAR